MGIEEATRGEVLDLGASFARKITNIDLTFCRVPPLESEQNISSDLGRL